jgi:DNA-binding protein YbaB
MKAQEFLKAKEGQEKLQGYYHQFIQLQQEIEKIENVGLAHNGLVKIVIDGMGQISSLHIDKQILQHSPELIENLVKEAYNSAATKNKEIIINMMEIVKNLFRYRGFDKQ